MRTIMCVAFIGACGRDVFTHAAASMLVERTPGAFARLRAPKTHHGQVQAP
jgi:hypothetical protein